MQSVATSHGSSCGPLRRGRMRVLGGALAALLITAATCRGTIHVDVNTGDDGNDGLGWATAVETISNGVALAVAGGRGTVLVATGTYYVVSNIVVESAITLRSWNAGELDPENTIIDGQEQARCMYINHNDALVAGFTITRGNGVGTPTTIDGSNFAKDGGGVFIDTGGGTLSNCMVIGNTADTRGGGIALYNHTAPAKIIDCLIADNIQTNTGSFNERGGGGIYITTRFHAPSTTRIINCRILNNKAMIGGGMHAGGGGIWFRYLADDAEMSGCTIAYNEARLGGGFGSRMSNGSWTGGIFRDNQIYNNTATSSGGGMYFSAPHPPFTIDSCMIVSNTAGTYAGIYWIDGGVSDRYGVLITNSVISYNKGSGGTIFRAWGGGSGAQACTYNYRIYNSIFEYNTNTHTTGSGGAIAFTYAGLWVENSVFRYNEAAGHPAIRFLGANENRPWVIRNCLIADNVARNGDVGGLNILAGDGGGWIESSTIVSNSATGSYGGLYIGEDAGVTNTIVYYNTAPTHPDWSAAGVAHLAYNCFSTNDFGLYPTVITNAPVFADSDYRPAAGSPGSDAGTNLPWMQDALDLDERPRLDRFSGKVDMGCYERIPRGMLFRMR